MVSNEKKNWELKNFQFFNIFIDTYKLNWSINICRFHPWCRSVKLVKKKKQNSTIYIYLTIDIISRGIAKFIYTGMLHIKILPQCRFLSRNHSISPNGFLWVRLYFSNYFTENFVLINNSMPKTLFVVLFTIYLVQKLDTDYTLQELSVPVLGIRTF